MKFFNRLLVGLLLLGAVPALAQPYGPQPVTAAPTGSLLCLNVAGNTVCNGVGSSATFSEVVPAGVTTMRVDSCAAGGGAGLGQASANTAGGGGGGAGGCSSKFPLHVTPGSTLVITVGAGVANGLGGSTTITGADNPFPPLFGGAAGTAGSGATGGSGGNGSSGSGKATAGGSAQAGGAAPAYASPYVLGGGSGAGGGNTGGTGGGGTGPWTQTTSGGSNGGGGGGGTSVFGPGTNGGANGAPGTTPSCCGGGAGGDGTNSTATIAGAGGFALLVWP